MEKNTTIRAEIEKYIQTEGISMQCFADASKVNPGTLSGILNRNPPRPISVNQLDLITEAMGLEEGSLFEMYVDECFIHSLPHWRRLRPFLLRCSELNKLECIRSVLGYLMDDLSNVPAIFETAEAMFEDGRYEASMLLYDCVIESEKYTHSERLAISYFRIFQIQIKDNQRNLKAAVQFHLYRSRLPEIYALEGLHMLSQVFALKMQWSEMEMYADELRELAQALYRNRNRFGDEHLELLKPLVYYYAQGHLLKASCYEFQGRYEESKQWIEGYADLSWFEGLDEEGWKVVNLHRVYAQGNRLCIEIKMGNTSAIYEYVTYLREHPDETLEGLNTLIESANRFGYFVDAELGLFSQQLKSFWELAPERWDTHYRKHFNAFRFASFCKVYAEYYFRKGDYPEGVGQTLHCLQLSVDNSYTEHIIGCMALFEQHRNFATSEQQQLYQSLCLGVRANEKNHAYDHSTGGYL
ncbi:tetratricopeptide (TPR) repeat protein [Paenibacillus polymyxa]|uniref:DNA-binding protein n=1 Tax=Paenibacillus polymyxa TaxID=1406 RepID=UPI00278D6267|nr:DNA-binding protein [Paenibacillus polymyxa]MDQ0049979.1 tetratricopeptide (TPR) repeat protein [Paenibacillus polymyxa]